MRYSQGRTAVIGVNLRLALRLKPQLYKQNPPARVKRTLIFRQSAQADLVFVAATSSRHGFKLTREIERFEVLKFLPQAESTELSKPLGCQCLQRGDFEVLNTSEVRSPQAVAADYLLKRQHRSVPRKVPWFLES